MASEACMHVTIVYGKGLSHFYLLTFSAVGLFRISFYAVPLSHIV